MLKNILFEKNNLQVSPGLQDFVLSIFNQSFEHISLVLFIV